MSVFNRPSQGVSEMLAAGVDYIVFKDGNGVEHKYVNLGNPKYCKREGVVEVVPLKTHNSHKHDEDKSFKISKDRKTGMFWGMPLDVDNDTKKIIHSPISVKGKTMFDLSVPEQAEIFACLKNGPFMEGSPNLVGKPSYKIKDKEEIAAKNIDKRSQRRKAEAIIESMPFSVLEEMARNMGINVAANRNVAMLTDEVYRVMELNPEEFLTIYNNPQREYLSLFNKALENTIIILDHQTKIYKYNGLDLGHNKEMAVKYLVDNTGIATAIQMICAQKDAGTLQSMAGTNVAKKAPENPADEVEKLKKRLAELEAVQGVPENLTTEVEAETPINSYATPETRQKAKELGIQGYALPKITEEMLLEKIQKIEKAKS